MHKEGYRFDRIALLSLLRAIFMSNFSRASRGVLAGRKRAVASQLRKLLAQFQTSLSDERFRWPVATCAIISLNLIAWFAVAWTHHLSPFAPQNSALLLRVGAVNWNLLGAGEWWRIITSQFLHVHFPHLIFNMLSLLLLGGMLELESGAWRLVVLYLLSGVAGQLVGVAVAPSLVSSGASQATMGLAGGVAVGLFRQRRAFTARLIILLAIVAVQCGLDLLAAGSIKAGHSAGFLAGALIAYVLHRHRGERHKA
jgi:rhomboid protease GluP